MCVLTPTRPQAEDCPTKNEGLRKRSTSQPSSTSSDDNKSTASASPSAIDIVGTFQRVDKNEILKYYMKTSVLKDFVTPGKPWVLVPKGSFMGYFDWVPERFRMGPWHPACAAYLGILTCWVWYECVRGFEQDPFPDFEPVQAWTLSWYYNVAGFAWTSWIVYKIFCSGFGWTSWGMYTVWSWTFTFLRHGLCAAAPFKPEWNEMSEQIRFPMLVQASVTFGVWNAAIGPSIYAQMTTPEAKKSYVDFFHSPLWNQLHVYNIVYAVINGVWGSPGRSLTKADFCLALALYIFYAYFYLVVLDRLGVHYYLVFSPRTPFALISWSILLACYYAAFPMWNTILTKFA